MANVKRQMQKKSVEVIQTLTKRVPVKKDDSKQNSEQKLEVLSETARKSVLNRLSRVIGHLQSIKRMVENNREIEAMLIQISAVKSAVNGVGREMLGELINVRCQNNSTQASTDEIDEMLTLVNRYLK